MRSRYLWSFTSIHQIPVDFHWDYMHRIAPIFTSKLPICSELRFPSPDFLMAWSFIFLLLQLFISFSKKSCKILEWKQLAKQFSCRRTDFVILIQQHTKYQILLQFNILGSCTEAQEEFLHIVMQFRAMLSPSARPYFFAWPRLLILTNRAVPF